MTYAHLAQALVYSMHTNLLLELSTAMQEHVSERCFVVADRGTDVEVDLSLDVDFEESIKKLRRLMLKKHGRGFHNAKLRIELSS